MITTQDLHELMKLKIADREKFVKSLAKSKDVLLNYKKFKEYPANI
jgi:hypothetical protein